MELKGKAAIVTGAGTGVGRAAAMRLARGGCSVLINYSRSKEPAEEAAAEARKLGVNAIAVQGDVSIDADCRRMAQSALDAFGRIDILVNNAGTTKFVPHVDMEALGPEDWHRILSVNLVGPYLCARACKDALIASGNGAIVNVSSVAGLAGMGSSIAYCASKAGLNNLTVTLARVFAPNVRVNAVAPGFITGRWMIEGLGAQYDSVKQGASDRTLLGRVSDPEDIAAAILGLIEGSDLITGVVLPIEAGAMINNFSPRGRIAEE